MYTAGSQKRLTRHRRRFFLRPTEVQARQVDVQRRHKHLQAVEL